MTTPSMNIDVAITQSEHLLQMLKQGVHCFILQVSDGNVDLAAIQLWITTDACGDCYLNWCPASVKRYRDLDCCIDVATILSIKTCKQSAALKSAAESANQNPSNCFSIRGEDQSIDLCTHSEQAAKNIIAAIKQVVKQATQQRND